MMKNLEKLTKLTFTLILILFSTVGFSQAVGDLFKDSEHRLYWLGVDYSHVKLIGDFSEFWPQVKTTQETNEGANSKETSVEVSYNKEKSMKEIRDTYFPKWNKLFVNEPEKYDFKGMFKKEEIYNDIEVVMDLNAKTPIEEMEAFNAPNFKKENIEKIVSGYSFKEKEGIGIIFIAECLNKGVKEAYYHFVAINLTNNSILLHERMRGEPRGFGLRNYWAGSVYDVTNQITKKKYKAWKKEYGK